MTISIEATLEWHDNITLQELADWIDGCEVHNIPLTTRIRSVITHREGGTQRDPETVTSLVKLSAKKGDTAPTPQFP